MRRLRAYQQTVQVTAARARVFAPNAGVLRYQAANIGR